MKEEKCCGTCRYHSPCDLKRGQRKPDWMCVGMDSEYFGEYTAYDDSCEEWEGRNEL